MASIKVNFRPPMAANREGTIYYQIIQGKHTRQLRTDYHVTADEWDCKRSTVATKTSGDRKILLSSIKNRISHDLERLSKIAKKMDADGLSYSADDLIFEFRKYSDKYSLFNYMEGIIIRLKENGKLRTSETYRATLNSFRLFRKNEDIMLDCLNSDIMEAFQAWHENRGNTPNTISFYNRVLRAVYNRAMENEIIKNRNPFRHVYTGVDKTVKRALPLQHIKEIKALDLSLMPSVEFARDMFMLSFYLRGMSFIDMAFLKKSDLKNGYAVYRRRKTGQQLAIEWTREMQMIVDKYPANPTKYLLPIIRSEGINERCAYKNSGYNINHNLKKVAKLININIPLTLYVARHSWASAAKAKGVPVSIISEGMGHDSETTTKIYLASLDTSLVDKANALILKSI